MAQTTPAAPPAPPAATAAEPAPSAHADNPVPATERRISIVTLRDLEAQAQKVLPADSYACIVGGAGDEWSMRENEAALNRWVIEPNFLSGHPSADTATTLFGSKIAVPVITPPMASHALVHTAAEAATAKGTDQLRKNSRCRRSTGPPF